MALWRDCRAPPLAIAARGLAVRAGGGWAHLPAAGGALDQPAWLMDALAAIDDQAAAMAAEG